MISIKQIILFTLCILIVFNKCAYRVDDKGWPIRLTDKDNQPHLIEGLTQCLQYNGKTGCCDKNNDFQQATSYGEIDGIFGYQGGGCDHCAINLKRFWCEYACSPNQADFIHVKQGYYPVPDPQKPGQNLTVQLLTLTVQAQTACDIYNSCKRNSFVASVSAMGSPAGFLTFQGHNAVDQAFQYISVNFSYNKNESLYFSDSQQDQSKKGLSPCNTKVQNDTWHQFKYNQNCKCNTCEQACDNNNGFIYQESSVFEGFNWILVGSTYLLFGGIVAIITIKRRRNKQKQN